MRMKKMFCAAAVAAASIAFAVPSTAMAAGWAYDSPEYGSPEYPSAEYGSPEWPGYDYSHGSASAQDVGVDFYAQCSYGDPSVGGADFKWVPVEASYSERQAKNVSLKAGEQVLASFEVQVSEDYRGEAPTHCTLNWTTPGMDLVGKDVKLFVEHNNGSTEVKNAKVEAEKTWVYDPDAQKGVEVDKGNGKVTVEVGGLSIYSLAVNKGVQSNNTNKTPDTTKPSGTTEPDGTAPVTKEKKSPQTGVMTASVSGLSLMAVIAAAGALRKSMTL